MTDGEPSTTVPIQKWQADSVSASRVRLPERGKEASHLSMLEQRSELPRTDVNDTPERRGTGRPDSVQLRDRFVRELPAMGLDSGEEDASFTSGGPVCGQLHRLLDESVCPPRFSSVELQDREV